MLTTSNTFMVSRARSLALGLCLALGALAAPACGGDKVVVKNLLLRVSSDAPRGGGQLASLRILFAKDGKHFPARLDQPEFNPVLDGNLFNPIAKPVTFSVAYDGATFGDGAGVSLEVTGLMANQPVTRFAGTVDLAADVILDVHLLQVGEQCDVDGDGFLDCANPACCPGGSAFADCEPSSAAANPWGTEDACEACSDTLDNDCQGGDAPCVDTDGDTIPDCREVACDSVNDPKVGPDLPEICDDRDNDCDSQTDEGLTINYLGQTLAKGAACGTGLCAGGKIECDENGGMRCSTDSLKHPTEDCATATDDDCNGLTNEGCALTDVDGDGYVGDQDCNDYDSGIFKGGQAESCCPASAKGSPELEAACDKNCDGEVVYCEDGDGDGDGYTQVAGDCDDTNAFIYPGAPERCGDGVDQDCFAGDLACAGLVDADGDGWPQEADCDDHNGNRRPDAPEVCDGIDNNCNNQIDEGNPTGKPAGETACGDTDGECGTQRGEWVCRNSGGEFVGTVDCVGDIEPVGSREAKCDGKDDDCDGQTDEDFEFDGGGVGAQCDGTGECGQGTVECSKADLTKATCSTNPDGSSSEAKPEICDQLDNDCDGTVNEGLTDVADSTCAKTGVCGANLAAISAECQPDGTWTCDYLAVPGYEADVEKSCDGKDNDCNGQTDTEFAVGTGCDGSDPDQCDDGTIVCSPTDATKAICNDGPTTDSGVEVCDGKDNDCDGETDEDFKTGGTVKFGGGPFTADGGKVLGESCGAGVCGGGHVVCDPADAAHLTLTCDSLSRGGTDSCNELDDDCDGKTDEEFLTGGSVEFNSGVFAADIHKHKGDVCGTGACSGGHVVCASLTTLACSTSGVASGELCNAIDDNCNGTADERFKAGGNVKYNGGVNGTDRVLGDTCGVGECGGGHVVCDAADGQKLSLTCDSLSHLTTDICNNKDDNCDGATDEDFLASGGKRLSAPLFSGDLNKFKGQACGTGACAAGTVVCTANGAAVACSTDANAAATETCDGVDNTCNGQTDEGQPDADGDGVSDACDTCTDVDGDGYRKAGTPGTGCAHATTDDCDDAVNNTSDPDGDNVCGASDNCPSVANPTQLNSDANRAGDTTGDACDTCTDADNDGWRLTGTSGTACAHATENDCDDAANNTNDPDGDNVCGASDNCPTVANATQLNSDANRAGDTTGDACDTCTDADNDGWRLAGTPGTACAHTTENDCDDAANNVNDPDGDNVCGASDNCPTVANASQLNSDSNRPNDSTGDACDTCTDADNDGWRLAGTAGTGCTHTTEDDCDDAVGNGSDLDHDNVCGASDNCPVDANPTQVNSDANRDALGDACDACTDADNDGYRATGTPGAACLHTTVDDCDDAANNVSDADGDNVCGASDNCPAVANADQANHDSNRDALGDACDTCTDADNDGWRLAGSSGTGCAHTTVDDCDDAADNASDPDGDNVCGASDNCPSVANPDQANADSNRDAIGDACDTCTDVDNDGWRLSGSTGAGCAHTTENDCDDAVGNSSDPDADNICGATDNCPSVANAGQENGDGDTYGNACDVCPAVTNQDQADGDSDGVGDVCDNCLVLSNHDQANSDADSLGDACDNCDLVSNISQTDGDADGVGDACDTCTDVDGDGWGVAGNNAGCGGGKAGVADCEDALANTVDVDHDNSCDGSDTCVDADGDGWGRSGFGQTTCAKAGNDCDDTATNATNDPDADNVCNNGGAVACGTGHATGCIDNCPSVANNTTGNVQLDTDRDGKGDSCDTACVLGPTPFEVCGDCIDNDCDGVTDESGAASGGCLMRRVIGIVTDVEPAPAGYSFWLQFDHKALVAAGQSTVSGNDIRVFYKDPTLACNDANYNACYREVDRVLEPLRAWNATDTAIWFAAEATIPELMYNTDYEVYFGATSGSPQADVADVFPFADFFDRADSAASIGNSWSVHDKDEGSGSAGTDVQIKSNQLDFVTTLDAAYAPYLSHTFPTLSSGVTGAWDVRVGFNWQRSNEGAWRVFMQLGLGSAMGAFDVAHWFDGLGPSLTWSTSSSLGTASGSTVTARGTVDPSGVSDIAMHLDFETAANPTYDLGFVNSTGTYVTVNDVPFSVAAQASIDTIRFGTDGVGTGFSRKAFDYVIVQRSVVTGEYPASWIGVEEPLGASCSLAGTADRVVQYKLDDATVSTSNPTTAVDSTSNPINLTRDLSGDNFGPDVASDVTFGCLVWRGILNDGWLYSAALGDTGNDLALLDGVTKATFEIVVTSEDVRTTNGTSGEGAYFVDLLREDDQHRLAFSQLSGSGAGNLRVTFNQTTQWTWTVNTVSAGRTVYHVVVDTTQSANGDRIRLYRDGFLLTATTTSAVAQNAVLDTITSNGAENTARVILGNDDDGNNGSNSMSGILYYAAVYKNALTSSEVLTNALILMRDDDR